MKKKLTRSVNVLTGWHDGLKGIPSPYLRGNVSSLYGDVSNLYGDVDGLRGYVSGLRGDVSGLRGDVSSLRGYVSGLRGDVDDCEITAKDRAKGIDINTLISE